jgi:hypothetical protein
LAFKKWFGRAVEGLSFLDCAAFLQRTPRFYKKTVNLPTDVAVQRELVTAFMAISGDQIRH